VRPLQLDANRRQPFMPSSINFVATERRQRLGLLSSTLEASTFKPSSIDFEAPTRRPRLSRNVIRMIDFSAPNHRTRSVRTLPFMSSLIDFVAPTRRERTGSSNIPLNVNNGTNSQQPFVPQPTTFTTPTKRPRSTTSSDVGGGAPPVPLLDRIKTKLQGWGPRWGFLNTTKQLWKSPNPLAYREKPHPVQSTAQPLKAAGIPAPLLQSSTQRLETVIASTRRSIPSIANPPAPLLQNQGQVNASLARTPGPLLQCSTQRLKNVIASTRRSIPSITNPPAPLLQNQGQVNASLATTPGPLLQSSTERLKNVIANTRRSITPIANPPAPQVNAIRTRSLAKTPGPVLQSSMDFRVIANTSRSIPSTANPPAPLLQSVVNPSQNGGKTGVSYSRYLEVKKSSPAGATRWYPFQTGAHPLQKVEHAPGDPKVSQIIAHALQGLVSPLKTAVGKMSTSRPKNMNANWIHRLAMDEQKLIPGKLAALKKLDELNDQLYT
jgi:hypothetical protein